MADFLSVAQRSLRMSRIRSKDTKPELSMARILNEAKLPYVRHAKLPGTPDFLVGGRVVVHVDGIFWHGKNFAKIERTLKPFWKNKISNNMRRDSRVDRRLRRMGFSVLRIW
jgi:DNA mismatch endonuclease (patch repair protein)